MKCPECNDNESIGILPLFKKRWKYSISSELLYGLSGRIDKKIKNKKGVVIHE
ncbi:hypothetical protein [Bacillus cereus group sp. BfR-BA-01328]|uniref:hypothetical protein n=1 Tax=Bacillus cereus group sp. BfR-BA-01328 TaxID=2920304 RepID=UPI001F5AA107